MLLSALLASAAAADDGAGRFYASVSGLFIVANDTEYEWRDDPAGADTADLSYNNSFGVLAAAGWEASPDLRAEMELGYRKLKLDKVKNRIQYDGNGNRTTPADADLDGGLKTSSLMLNGYWVFGRWGEAKPYLGGGIGVAKHEGYGRADDFEDTVFAYQAMLGVGYELSENTELRLGYRYFATRDMEDEVFPEDPKATYSYSTHNIEAGVAFRF